MKTPVDDVVEIEVRIRARPETVFAYFIDPGLYVRWQGTSTRLDPRPGGIYEVSMDDGSVASGRYIAVELPDRVVFTWGWVGDDTLPPGQSTVEVTFRGDRDDTIVRLRHLALPSTASREQHAQGWHHFLGRLVDVGAEAVGGAGEARDREGRRPDGDRDRSATD